MGLVFLPCCLEKVFKLPKVNFMIPVYVSLRVQTTNGFVFRFPNVKNVSLAFSCVNYEGDISCSVNWNLLTC